MRDSGGHWGSGCRVYVGRWVSENWGLSCRVEVGVVEREGGGEVETQPGLQKKSNKPTWMVGNKFSIFRWTVVKRLLGELPRYLPIHMRSGSTRRSTSRISLVEFGNSIRIAWVASFSDCFIDAHSSVSVNAGGATCSSKELQVAPNPLIGPTPDSRCPIDIGKCDRCNLPRPGGKLHRHFHSSTVPDGR